MAPLVPEGSMALTESPVQMENQVFQALQVKFWHVFLVLFLLTREL